jgi:hypothetical protein
MMEWSERLAEWRKLSPEEKQIRRIRAIPQSVARTMAFEGEPISPETLCKMTELIETHVSSKLHKES